MISNSEVFLIVAALLAFLLILYIFFKQFFTRKLSQTGIQDSELILFDGNAEQGTLSFDDQESIEKFQDIEDNGTVEDMIDYINNWGDEDRLADYGIKSDAHVKKFAKSIMENVVTEGAPKMAKNVEAENIQDLMNQIANAQKGGGSGRYGKEFEKAKTKALRAIKDMVTYAKIGR